VVAALNAGAEEIEAQESSRSERWRRFPYSTFCWRSLLSHGKCFWRPFDLRITYQYCGTLLLAVFGAVEVKA